jgi:hypothetical protein
MGHYCSHVFYVATGLHEKPEREKIWHERRIESTIRRNQKRKKLPQKTFFDRGQCLEHEGDMSSSQRPVTGFYFTRLFVTCSYLSRPDDKWEKVADDDCVSFLLNERFPRRWAINAAYCRGRLIHFNLIHFHLNSVRPRWLLL